MSRTISILMILAVLPWCGCQPKSETDQAAQPDTAQKETAQKTADFRPTLYLELPESCPTPDGLTLDDATGTIYLNCPNFAERDENGKKIHPSVLMAIDRDGKLTELLQYEVHPETGEVGPMGLDIGPDGHLYVADNQYFVDSDHKSRVLRVEMKDGKPTGKVDVVVDGLKLPNSLNWKGDKMYVTDTFLDLPEKFGIGGVWQFSLEKLNAGPVKVEPNGTDKHLIVKLPETKKIGREDRAGADGSTFDAEGNLWVGNFGDGVVNQIIFDENDQVKEVKTVVDTDEFQCCDGIFFDAGTGLIYLNDSQVNAIRTLDPKTGKLAMLWKNGDTDGADGLLDQPAECVVRDGKLIIANFDWSFPGLLNKKHDKPHTMSVIDLTPSEKK